MNEKTYTLLCPFGGLGAGALGFVQAETRLFQTRASFKLLGGVDVDEAACADFEYLTGTLELHADVWQLSADDLRKAFGERAPDVVFMSPPCKGASGLLSEKQAKSAKYRKLNQLALRWVTLMLEAWSKAPPRLVLFENVPRIISRAKRVLAAVRAHLRRAGYVIHEGFHDCGEFGGLAQHRKRYLMVARHQSTVSSLLYQPIKKRVRACGEVLGALPMPNDPAAGPLHRLPQIGWPNWVRLAHIPAGGDWRDLQGVLEDGQKRREKFKRHAVERWAEPTGTIGGSGSNGVENVADPRAQLTPTESEQFRETLGIVGWGEAAGVVTGAAAVSRGRFAVADPRPQLEVTDARKEAYGVLPWDKPTKAVIGAARLDNSDSSIADPRPRAQLKPDNGPDAHWNKYAVNGWQDPAPTVIGATRPGSGGPSLADPRVQWFGNVLRVVPWGEPTGTITHAPAPSSGGAAVADPRVKVAFDHGYKVTRWDAPSDTIAGGSHPGQGAYSVADVRVDRFELVGIISHEDALRTVWLGDVPPEIDAPFAIVDPGSDGAPRMVIEDATKAPPAAPVILAADGTWHRPLTTLELAVLQGLPAEVRGAPLTLAGTSASAHRERIGNAVPVQAATAIAEQMLLTLLSSDLGAFSLSSAGGVWVTPDVETVAAIQ